MITQRELRELVADIPLADRVSKAFHNLRKRVLAGEEVEPGELVPWIVPEDSKRLSFARLCETFGDEKAKRIVDRCQETYLRRLKISIGGSQLVGWSELSQRGTVKRAEESGADDFVRVGNGPYGLQHKITHAVLVGLCLLGLCSRGICAEKEAPGGILGGKPALTQGSGRYYDNRGANAGKATESGKTVRFYDSRGAYAGKADSSTRNSTRSYDGRGAYSGKATSSGSGARFYDSRGAYSGKSIGSGNVTHFYDGKGAYSGKAVTSGGTTRFYDQRGAYSGKRTN